MRHRGTQGWGEHGAPGRVRKQRTLARACARSRASSSTAAAAATPWRLEWGPSQRPYIQGQELRLRAELSVPRELQALVLNRELMESMEKAVFDQYVEGVQTRIDTTTPPEMRWLVMFPKLSGTELRTLRDGYGALSSYKPWLQQWLAGSLTPALAALPTSAERPLVLMIGAPPPDACARRWPSPTRPRWTPGCGCSNARCRKRSAWPSTRSTCDTPSTQPSMFSASTMPLDAARP